MDKNSIIGFILIALILFGFTFFQSRQNAKRLEAQRIQDSIALANMPQDSLAAAAAPLAEAQGQAAPAVAATEPSAIYADSLLEAAHNAEAAIATLENELVKLEFTSKGAQPYSAQIKKYSSYGGGELMLFRGGDAEYAVSIYAGQYIRTSDFIFQLAEQTDTTLVYRLPFGGGGYIEQRYTLLPDSYKVDNLLSFVGMDGIIPRNVGSYDIDFNVTIPRLEKGYRNESQYSKLDYYFPDEKKPVEIGRGRSNSKRIDSKLQWFAFQQQFFSSIVYAPKCFDSGEVSVDFLTVSAP